MWICPKCERTFKSTNQSHSCGQYDLDDLFKGKPDNLLMTFDALLLAVIDWEGCTVGATAKAIVFTREKAWLIVRPMSKVLDIKFYDKEKISHPLIKKTNFAFKKYAHHIRISNPSEITTELLELLNAAFNK